MSGEKGNFRTRLFGGFNRQDVISYIEELASRRTACEKERDRLRGELDAANDRVSSLENESASLRREIDRLRSQLSAERKSRTEAISAVKAETNAAADEVMKLLDDVRDSLCNLKHSME